MNDGDIASAILDAGAAARSIPPFTGTLPDFDLPRAYRVGAEVARRRQDRGERVVGWKVGFTNTTIWDRYGVHAPIWAPVYDTTLRVVDRAGETARCDLAGLCEPRIEPEIVLRFARRPVPGMDESELLACVDAVAHGFEIVQSLYPGWRFRAPDTVAAFGLHGRLYRGPLVAIGGDAPRWYRDLSGVAVSLARDGVPMDEGRGTNVLGGPLSACRHFVEGLAADGSFRRGIEPGDLVTTGTITDAHPVAAGETWTTRIAGLDVPGMSIAFA